MTEPTAEQPQVTATATVSPPAPSRSRWGAIPHHLGRARTSTVVLSLLFLAIGALWINIRPEQPPTVTVGVDQPVAPATTAVPTTPTPTSETTPEQPTPTEEEAPTTAVPTDTTTPEGTTTSTPPPPTATTPAPTAVPTAVPTASDSSPAG